MGCTYGTSHGTIHHIHGAYHGMINGVCHGVYHAIFRGIRMGQTVEQPMGYRMIHPIYPWSIPIISTVGRPMEGFIPWDLPWDILWDIPSAPMIYIPRDVSWAPMDTMQDVPHGIDVACSPWDHGAPLGIPQSSPWDPMGCPMRHMNPV